MVVPSPSYVVSGSDVGVVVRDVQDEINVVTHDLIVPSKLDVGAVTKLLKTVFVTVT